MPVLKAIAVLLLMQLAGEALVKVTGLPFPGSLIGLLLLFAALAYRGGVPKGLRDTSGHLLQHLLLLFIPPVAGIMMYFDRIAREWLPFLAACIGGAALTVMVTAFVFQWALRRFYKETEA